MYPILTLLFLFLLGRKILSRRQREFLIVLIKNSDNYLDVVAAIFL
jgi:hypothetical protein